MNTNRCSLNNELPRSQTSDLITKAGKQELDTMNMEPKLSITVSIAL